MLMIGRPPWMAANQLHLAEKVRHFELSFPCSLDEKLDPQYSHLKNLLRRMLEREPDDRATMVFLQNDIVCKLFDGIYLCNRKK
jgi:serine/threonine protein kinase